MISLPMVVAMILALIALNMRLYLAIIAGVLVYFLFINPIPINIAAQRLVAPTLNVAFLAVPFFVLLGTLLSFTGIATRLLGLADLLVGRLRGGMALANVMLSTLMGGMSASNLADASMTARMMVPEMERNGYSRAFAAAVTAASSLITPIIPPGIALIIYALLANVSVGRMFLAGILPGLTLAALLMLTTYVIARRRGYKPTRTTWPAPAETGRIVLGAWPAVVVVVAVVGGIRLNVFTPTEAGAFAVFLVLVLGLFVYRDMRFHHVLSALVETGKVTASIMLVVMASSALAWVFALEQMGQVLALTFAGVTESPLALLFVLNLLFLVLGTLVEGTALMIILVPILLPTVLALGVDPIHFGIIIIVNLSIGTLTPPIGTVMLVVCNISRVQVSDFLREGAGFYLALFIGLAVITMVPELSLFLTR